MRPTVEEHQLAMMRMAADSAIATLANPTRRALAIAAHSAPALAVETGGSFDGTGTYRRRFILGQSKLGGSDLLG